MRICIIMLSAANCCEQSMGTVLGQHASALGLPRLGLSWLGLAWRPEDAVDNIIRHGQLSRVGPVRAELAKLMIASATVHPIPSIRGDDDSSAPGPHSCTTINYAVWPCGVNDQLSGSKWRPREEARNNSNSLNRKRLNRRRKRTAENGRAGRPASID